MRSRLQKQNFDNEAGEVLKGTLGHRWRKIGGDIGTRTLYVWMSTMNNFVTHSALIKKIQNINYLRINLTEDFSYLYSENYQSQNN